MSAVPIYGGVMSNPAFLVRIGIAIAPLAFAFVITFRRQRRIRTATLKRPALRRLSSTPPCGHRCIESRLRPLGFQKVGDFDLCEADDRRVHRFLMSRNAERTGVFHVGHTHPNDVTQTVRGVKHGTEQALLTIHDEAIALFRQEDRHERRPEPDPNGFALGVLVEAAASGSIRTKRTRVSAGAGAHRASRSGRAQIGRAIEYIDPAELTDDAAGQDLENGA